MKLGGQMLEKGLDFYRDPGLATMVAKEVAKSRASSPWHFLGDDPDTCCVGAWASANGSHGQTRWIWRR